jgi:hypothetical protein
MPNTLLEWPDERLCRLTKLWADPGYSVTAIARELETNLPAVKRRAKFLALEGRPANRLSPWFAARRELLRSIGHNSDG